MNYEKMQEHKLFRNIKTDELKAMLNCLNYKEKKYQAGEYIDLCDNSRCIGIILDGKVSLVSEDVWGTMSLLTVAGEGELIGETFACGQTDNDIINFIATTDCEIIFLDFEKVFHSCTVACLFHHRLIENIVELIAQKNYQLMKKSNIVSQHTLRRKIMQYLSNQAKINKSYVFTVPLNRTQLADYLATDRTALSRELGKMKEEGIIDFQKNSFRILV